MSSFGIISGTPAIDQDGMFTFTVQSSNGVSAETQTFTMQIYSGAGYSIRHILTPPYSAKFLAYVNTVNRFEYSKQYSSYEMTNLLHFVVIIFIILIL